MQRFEFVSDKGKVTIAVGNKYHFTTCSGIDEGEIERVTEKYLEQDGADYLTCQL